MESIVEEVRFRGAAASCVFAAVRISVFVERLSQPNCKSMSELIQQLGGTQARQEAAVSCVTREMFVAYEEEASSAGKHGVGCFSLRGTGQNVSRSLYMLLMSWVFLDPTLLPGCFVAKFHVNSTALERSKHEFVCVFCFFLQAEGSVEYHPG